MQIWVFMSSGNLGMALLQHMIILFNILKFARLHSQAAVCGDSILCIIDMVSWWWPFRCVRGNACVFRVLRTNGVDIFYRIILPYFEFWLYVLHHAIHTQQVSKSRRLLNSESTFSWLLVCVEPRVLGDLNVSLARLRAPEEIREAYQGVCEDASREVNRIWVAPSPDWGPELSFFMILITSLDDWKFSFFILVLGTQLRAGVQEILEVIYCCLGPLCPW